MNSISISWDYDNNMNNDVFNVAVAVRVQFSSVQLLSRVRLFVTPWTTACQDTSKSILTSNLWNVVMSSLFIHSFNKGILITYYMNSMFIGGPCSHRVCIPMEKTHSWDWMTGKMRAGWDESSLKGQWLAVFVGGRRETLVSLAFCRGP